MQQVSIEQHSVASSWPHDQSNAMQEEQLVTSVTHSKLHDVCNNSNQKTGKARQDKVTKESQYRIFSIVHRCH